MTGSWRVTSLTSSMTGCMKRRRGSASTSLLRTPGESSFVRSALWQRERLRTSSTSRASGSGGSRTILRPYTYCSIYMLRTCTTRSRPSTRSPGSDGAGAPVAPHRSSPCITCRVSRTTWTTPRLRGMDTASSPTATSSHLTVDAVSTAASTVLRGIPRRSRARYWGTPTSSDDSPASDVRRRRNTSRERKVV